MAPSRSRFRMRALAFPLSFWLFVTGPSPGEYSGEVWVDVPAAYTLALAGPQASPVARELRVELSLPSAAPATLRLYDVAGREVAAREVGSLGTGRHAVELGSRLRIPSGIYFIRLIQGAQAVSARVCVVR